MPATPAKPLEIDRPRQLAALASPARQEVVDAIAAAGPSTIAEIAAALGRPADRLYFHVRALERVGLLNRIGERRDGRHVAKIYDVPGRPLRLRYQPDSPSNARAVGAVVDGVLRLARRDFRRALSSPDAVVDGPARDTWGGRMRGWASERDLHRVNELIAELHSLLQTTSPRDGARAVALTWVLTPLKANIQGPRSTTKPGRRRAKDKERTSP